MEFILGISLYLSSDLVRLEYVKNCKILSDTLYTYHQHDVYRKLQ